MKHSWMQKTGFLFLSLWISGACLTQAEEPTNFTGLALWMKADAGVFTNAGGIVTNWVDQSGSGKVITNSEAAATQPKLTISWRNGKPALYQSSSGTYGLTTPVNTMSITGGQSRTIFLVVGPGGGEVFGPNTSYCIGVKDINDTIRLRNVNNTFYTAAGVVPAGGAYVIAVAGSNGSPTNVSIYRNGVQVGSTNNFDCFFYSLTNAVGIGWSRYSLAGRTFVGYFAEVVVYDRVLSSNEHLSIGSYLSQKYSIAGYGAPPAVSNLAGEVIRRSTSAVLGAKASGVEADVWFLWSTNAAIGPNLSGWDGTNVMPNALPETTLLRTASNLLPSTLYYWTCLATNGNGMAWSPMTNSLTTHASLKACSNTPPVMDGLVMHLDPTTLPYTNNEYCDWWPDADGNNVEFSQNQNGSAYRPRFVSSVPAAKNRPVVRFNRNGLTNGRIGAVGDDQNRTIFIVAIPANAGISETIGYGSGCVIDLAGARGGGVPTNSVKVRRLGSVYGTTNSLSMSQPHIVAVTDQGGGTPPTRIYVDGVESSPFSYDGASGTDASTRFFGWTMDTASMCLGLSIGNEATRSYVGDVAEILLYDRVLSTNEHQKVGTHLELRYGLNTAYRWVPGTVCIVR